MQPSFHCICHFLLLGPQKQLLEVALYYPIFLTLLETSQHNCVCFYSFQASCILCPWLGSMIFITVFMRIHDNHGMELELAVYIRITVFIFVFKSSLGSQCKKWLFLQNIIHWLLQQKCVSQEEEFLNISDVTGSSGNDMCLSAGHTSYWLSTVKEEQAIQRSGCVRCLSTGAQVLCWVSLNSGLCQDSPWMATFWRRKVYQVRIQFVGWIHFIYLNFLKWNHSVYMSMSERFFLTKLLGS